jgi:hypothetical protein
MATIGEEQVKPAIHTANNYLAKQGNPGLLHVTSGTGTDLSHVTAVFFVR